MDNENSNDRSGRRAFVIIIVFIIALIIAAFSFIGYRWYKEYKSAHTYSDITDYVDITSHQAIADKELPDNPVEFSELQKVNSEIYAWIYVPNTRVNYPIAQSKVDDTFYLHRDYKKNYLFAGTIYTELCNALDFSDPVTLVYGHNMYKSEGTMFTTLHYFEDESFFDDNEYFYIYLPKHILTYRIVSAYKYDNRHIMNSFDFLDEKVRSDYFDYVTNPNSILKNVRQGAELGINDKLVVLSTCISGDKSSRFLVNGVLIKDEQTK